jgi:hypothetical protein
MFDLKTLTTKLPRLFWCFLIALILFLLLAFIAPQQVPVMLYKVGLVLAAGYCGFLLDRWVFPYAQPGGYLATPWAEGIGFKEGKADHAIAPYCTRQFLAACYRRTAIICGCMLAVGLGL